MKLSASCVTLMHDTLPGYHSIATPGQKASEPRFNAAVWSNEINLFLITERFLSKKPRKQLFCTRSEEKKGTQELLKSIKTILCVKSNVMPAAFHWYLHCTAVCAAGCRTNNPPTMSHHLLYEGAASTCQHTVAQFYLSIASGSLVSITLQKLCWCWSAV